MNLRSIVSGVVSQAGDRGPAAKIGTWLQSCVRQNAHAHTWCTKHERKSHGFSAWVAGLQNGVYSHEKRPPSVSPGASLSAIETAEVGRGESRAVRWVVCRKQGCQRAQALVCCALWDHSRCTVRESAGNTKRFPFTALPNFDADRIVSAGDDRSLSMYCRDT